MPAIPCRIAVEDLDMSLPHVISTLRKVGCFNSTMNYLGFYLIPQYRAGVLSEAGAQ
jgi:hypothetical protein